MGRERHPTEYKGVFYRMVPKIGGKRRGVRPDDLERMYYAVWTNPEGKVIEAKVGRQSPPSAMTAAKANQIRSEYAAGTRSTPEARREAERIAEEKNQTRPTLARLWDEYKKDHPDLKGLVTDENRFEKHIGPLIDSEKRTAPGYKATLADKSPEELVPLDLDRLKHSLTKSHKPATVRNVLELVRRIVNFGVRKKRTAGLSFKIGTKKSGASVEFPSVNNEKTEDLNADQLSALLKAIDEAPNVQAASLMRLALLTGMRRGELFKLRWDDIDEQRGFVLIRDPKGKKDQHIPLNDDARAVLDGLPKDPKSPYVFPGRKGGQRVDVNKAVREITKAAGLPDDFRPLHGLRHTFASMLASSGQVDLYTLQKLLTHKSATMTQRYAHLRDDALKDAAALAGSIVKASTEKAKKGKVKAIK